MTIEAILQAIQKVINSNILTLALEATIAYLAILWIAIIIWVSKDANNRTNSLLFQVFSILIVIILTPLFGLLLYLIIRPTKTLTEKYLESIQLQILDEEGKKDSMEKCPSCNKHINKEYKFCPHCAVKLQKICFSCKKMYQTNWDICPYCGKKEPMKGKKQKASNDEMKENMEL
jgi:hypothetical protein